MKADLGKCKLLLDNGFSLITVGDKKIPNIAWKKYQTKAFTKVEFEAAYNLSTTKGVGILTGFNGLEVFDIDLKIFTTLKDQQDFWTEYLTFLKDNILDFDDKFVIYKTVNGGYHILYRCDINGGNQKIAKLKGHSEAVIETRGVGGYVFIYENQISKKSYLEVQEISELDRAVLFDVSRFYNYVEEFDKIIPERIAYVGTGEVKPWDDYNSKVSIFDILNDEVDIIKQLSDKYIIRRNGATSPHSGYVYKNSGCMYLFTTGTIYPHEKLISPFTAFTIKHHNGDFSSSAKEIYAKGYGSRVVKKIKEFEKTPDKKRYDDIKFPLDIFPVEIQNYILDCKETLFSSVDYMGCSFLWALSVTIGNCVKIQVKPGWVEPATLWMTIVGHAGIGKTPSISNTVFPLQKENNREIRKFVKAYEKYDAFQELDKEQKKNTEQIKKPRKSQFIADDITLEALVDLHEENKNAVGVFKDELAGWIKDMNKYRAGSDLEFWLSTWSAKSVSLNRKTSKSAHISQPLIPVLGGIQPGIFDSFYNDENKDNGFIDRMLLCYPDLQVEEYNDSELSPDKINWYNDYLVSLYRDIRSKVVRYDTEDDIDPYIAFMLPDAKLEWKRIFNKITAMQNDDDENEYMKSMLPKQKSYIPRFALLINCLQVFNRSESAKEFCNISTDAILAAERLSDYFINMAKKIKVSSNEVNDIRKSLKLTATLSKFEQFELIYRSNPNCNKKEVAERLQVSRKTIYGYIERVTQGDTKSVTPKLY